MPIIVTDYITTTNPSDTYATHSSALGLGGYREVADTTARDNIPLERRQVGMLVFSVSEQKLWRLTNAGLNSYVEVLLLEGEIVNPVDGNVLRYNSGLAKWESGPASTFSINDATDIVITTPVTGEVLIFDGADWVNGSPALSNISDVNYPIALSVGQVLAYSGTEWVNKDVPQFNISNPQAGETLTYNAGNWENTVAAAPTLDNLGNTLIATPATGDYLRYNGNTLQWVNQPADALSIDDLSNVATLTPQPDDVLTYNGANWTNVAIPVQDKSITDLLDVSFSINPAARDILRYDGAAWTNEPLIDFGITSPLNGQYLRYNSTTFEWENAVPDAIAIQDLSNVTITTPTVGDAIIWNGSGWVNDAPVDPAPPTVEQLTDVSYYANPLLVGQVLTYDGTNWTNQDSPNIVVVDPVEGEVLAYNSLTGDWENQQFSTLSSTIDQVTHGFVVGDLLRHNGTIYVKALADVDANAQVVGIVSSVVTANRFVLVHAGVVSTLSGLTVGATYYLDATTPGGYTTTAPIAGIVKPVFVSVSATTAVFFIAASVSSPVIDGGELQLLPLTYDPLTEQIIAGPVGTVFGVSLAMDYAGTTLLVGARLQDESPNTNNGAVFYYEKVNGTWTSQQTLLASNRTNDNWFGYHTAVNPAGNYSVVGAPNRNNGFSLSGGAYVFFKETTVWNEQQYLEASDKAINDSFGYDTSINSAGDTVAIGARAESTSTPTNTTSNGAVYIFTRSGAVWTQQAKLLAIDKASSDFFGAAVALDATGDTLIVGAPGDDNVGQTINAHGSVYVFKRTGVSWAQQQKIEASPLVGAEQLGWSVSINAAGTVLAAGAPLTGLGSVYIYTWNGSSWVFQQRIFGSDSISGDQFGYSVKLTAAGDALTVGARDHNGSRGAVYVFTNEGGTWTQQQKLTASNETPGLGFGVSVAISETGSSIATSGRDLDLVYAYERN